MTAARDEWGPTGLDLVDATAPPTLSRGGADRAALRRRDPGWLDAAWARGRLLRLAADGTTAVTGDPPRLDLRSTQGERPPHAWLLGADTGGGERDGGTTYWGERGGLPQGTGLRDVGALLGDRDAGLLTTAAALGAWHATHTHCPRCGAPTEVVDVGWATRCTLDGSDHFPRTDPAVIVLITSPDGVSAVLGRQPSWPRGRWSCLAGFVEAGESAEQCVVREVREEAGIDVRDVRSVSSQPWPFPRSLMLGFSAVADRDVEPSTPDHELEAVRWWSRAEVRAAGASGELVVPPPVSIANLLISRWLVGG